MVRPLIGLVLAHPVTNLDAIGVARILVVGVHSYARVVMFYFQVSCAEAPQKILSF